MTREHLARLLEGEGLNAAAEDVQCGQDPATVCAQAVRIGPRYDDGGSRDAMATLQAIAEGRVAVDA